MAAPNSSHQVSAYPSMPPRGRPASHMWGNKNSTSGVHSCASTRAWGRHSRIAAARARVSRSGVGARLMRGWLKWAKAWMEPWSQRNGQEKEGSHGGEGPRVAHGRRGNVVPPHCRNLPGFQRILRWLGIPGRRLLARCRSTRPPWGSCPRFRPFFVSSLKGRSFLFRTDTGRARATRFGRVVLIAGARRPQARWRPQ